MQYPITAIFILTEMELLKMRKEIENNEILEYSDLINLLFKGDLFNLLSVASSHTLFFTSYLNSKRNKLKKDK